MNRMNRMTTKGMVILSKIDGTISFPAPPIRRPMSLPNWNFLADRALAGELLTRDEARAVLGAPDDALLDQLAAAYRVRRHYWGNRVRLHFLLNAQSGLCPEDCGYCSQSKVSGAEIEKYPMLARERILEAADRAAALKAGTFCMVISGRSPGGRVF